MQETALIDALTSALIAARDAVELEQAAHGLDSWRELDLQAALAAGLVRAGFFVARERRYPGDRVRRQKTSGRRCDLVVTADGPLLLEHGQPDLFSKAPQTAQEAAWIEVKVAKQFGARGGNEGWQHALLTPPKADVERLAGDAALHMRALVVVLFTAHEAVAVHDLAVWRKHVLAAGLSLGPMTLRHFPITDRVGNACCTLAWSPVEDPTRLG